MAGEAGAAEGDVVMKAKIKPEAWPGGPKQTGECANCGEPYYRFEGFTNKRVKCPHCDKWGCSTCVTYRETGTCCCAPYDNGGDGNAT